MIRTKTLLMVSGSWTRRAMDLIDCNKYNDLRLTSSKLWRTITYNNSDQNSLRSNW